MLKGLVFSTVLLAGISTASADLLFDRGLPTANLNNISGSNRSNVCWYTNNPYAQINWLMGDDFKVSGSGTYKIDTIRVWVVDGISNPIDDSKLLLWGGTTGGSMSLLSNSFTKTLVTYADSSTYQGSSGSMLKMYQVDFDVNWYVGANVLQSFYVGGNVAGSTPSLHGSNGALSGSTQEGADNFYRWAYFDGSTLTEDGTGTSLGYGWDKASDFNVQALGNAVPGPAAILPFAIGLVARLRRRK